MVCEINPGVHTVDSSLMFNMFIEHLNKKDERATIKFIFELNPDNDTGTSTEHYTKGIKCGGWSL
jgi:hypothetical protein